MSVLARVVSNNFSVVGTAFHICSLSVLENILYVGLCSEGDGDHGLSCDCVW